MTPIHKTLLALTALTVAGSAQAALLTIDSTIGGVPTGVNYVNFNDLAPGSSGAMTASGPSGSVLVTVTPNAKVVQGSKSGEYAAPFLSNNQGAMFDGAANGVDVSTYLTTGSISGNGSIKLDFLSNQQYIGLLWGSVDGYNRLSFYDEFNNLLGTVTGGDVLGSPTGDQGANGTTYVNINSDTPFRYVLATSDGFAFEFDNVAYNDRPVTVPDHGFSLALLGAGFAGLGCFRRLSR